MTSLSIESGLDKFNLIEIDVNVVCATPLNYSRLYVYIYIYIYICTLLTTCAV